jgi:hypothetical protein
MTRPLSPTIAHGSGNRLEMVEEARSAIATAIPAVVDAPLTVVLQFY